jgi:hypothetical protein
MVVQIVNAISCSSCEKEIPVENLSKVKIDEKQGLVAIIYKCDCTNIDAKIYSIKKG